MLKIGGLWMWCTAKETMQRKGTIKFKFHMTNNFKGEIGGFKGRSQVRLPIIQTFRFNF